MGLGHELLHGYYSITARNYLRLPMLSNCPKDCGKIFGAVFGGFFSNSWPVRPPFANRIRHYRPARTQISNNLKPTDFGLLAYVFLLTSAKRPIFLHLNHKIWDSYAWCPNFSKDLQSQGLDCRFECFFYGFSDYRCDCTVEGTEKELL